MLVAVVVKLDVLPIAESNATRGAPAALIGRPNRVWSRSRERHFGMGALALLPCYHQQGIFVYFANQRLAEGCMTTELHW